jgi:hypothetical protein
MTRMAERVAENKRHMNPAFIWRCECSAGWCNFDTKRAACESSNSQFCGRGLIKRVKRAETTKEAT